MKQKNNLSVGLKTSKKEKQEVTTDFQKQILESETRISKLSDYGDKKIAEEREALLKSRKELKKAKQKSRKDEEKESSDAKRDFEDNVKKEGIEEVGNKTCEEIKPEEKNPVSDINCNSTREDNLASDVAPADSFREEDEEGFIGPKIPKMMTKADKEAFLEELRAIWRY